MRLLTFGIGLTLSFSFAILYGFFNFVFVLGFPAFPIPTVSETWLYKPSNFVSRQIVISGSLALSLLFVGIFFTSVELTQNRFAASFLLAIALIATFCLGVIGGVCMDDTSPQCLSSVTLHDHFAVTYFILIDLWMFGMSLLFPTSVFRISCAVFSFGVTTMTTMTTTTNWASYYSPTNSYTGTVEWINTLAMFSFILSFIQEKMADVHVGVFNAHDAKVQALVSLGNATLTTVTLSIYVLTLVLGFIFYDKQVNGFPEVSDFFVLPPGNSLGRLLGVSASTCLFPVLIQFYIVYQKQIEHPQFAWIMSFAFCLLLSLCACVSKVEDNWVHFLLVAGFFSCFQCFQLLLFRNNAWMTLSCSISLVAKCRLGIWDLHLFAMLEFMDLMASLAFLASFAWQHVETLAQHPYGLFRTVEEDDEKSKIMLA